MEDSGTVFTKDGQNDSRKKIKIAAIIFAVILIIILLLVSCGRGKQTDASVPAAYDLTTDANATSGGLATPDIDAIKKSLNEQVEKGMINISMNMNPVFSTGSAEGTLRIVNEDINIYPQVVEIYKSDGELIYRSGLIPVGSAVEKAKLATDLEAGNYECVAYFNAVDGKTGALMGRAGAEIVVTVLQ